MEGEGEGRGERDEGKGKEKNRTGEKLRSYMRRYFVNSTWLPNSKEPYSFSPGRC